MRHDVSSFLDDDQIEVQIDGKNYNIPSPSARDGLWLSRLANFGAKVASESEPSAEDLAKLEMDDDEERELYEIVLGPVYGELIEDNVSWVRISRLGRWAFIYFALGPEQAEQAREAGALTGGAARPNRAQKRATSSSSTRTAGKAAASKTPRRGSTGSSTPRKATARAVAR